MHLEGAHSEIGWEYVGGGHIIDLKIHIIVEKELPNMEELACLKCAIGEGYPWLEDFSMDVHHATLEKVKGVRHHRIGLAYLCSNLR